MNPAAAASLRKAASWCALAAPSLLALMASSPEPALPAGERVDLQANLYTASTQANAVLDLAADGRVMVAWDSRRQEIGGYGVYARCFDAAGRPLSHELRVNQTVQGMQRRPAVAFAPDGAAWFAWESFGQDGSGSAIVARRFAADLAAAGPELPVNESRDGDQSDVAIAANERGDVLVVWADPKGVKARRISEPGSREISLSAPQVHQRDALPAVSALPGGRFLVAWARTGAGVVARFLSSSGAPLGDELSLSDSAAAIEPSISADGRGRLVAAWLEPQDGGYVVLARRFDPRGAPLAAATAVAGAADGWKSGVAVTMAPDGRYAVAYNSDNPASGQDLHAHHFSAEGVEQRVERVTCRAAGDQYASVASGARRAAWGRGDQLAFAWNGDAGGGDASAANLTLLARSAAGLPAPPELGVPQAAAVTEEDFQAAIPPIWDPNFVPQPPLRSRAASGDFGFEAVPGTGWTPPDPEIAVGPDRLAFIVNGRIACFDKAGAQQWFDEIESSFGFWGALGTGGFVFDPEVTWDPHARRFLAMACERTSGQSYFLFAVSKDQTPDSATDWWKYRFNVTALAGGDIDSPNLAASRDYILLSADFFSPNDKYLLYILDKASILNGGAASTRSELISGTGQQSMGIPVVYDNSATLYVLQSTEFSNNTTVILHAITNPFTTYQRQTFTLGVPAYTYPADPVQKGTTSRPELFEPRFWSVAQRDGSLWAVHHVNNQRARVRWYEIDLNGWPGGGNPSLAQNGEIELGDGIYTFFPSIHVDAAGNAAITFSRSSAKEYISMGRALRGPSDPLNTFRPVQVVQTSANAHTTGRWGDYSGTQAEPDTAGTFWGHHEFTNGSTGSWRTWAAQYLVDAQRFVLDVPPLTAGSPTTLTASGAQAGGRVYFAYSTTGVALYEIAALSCTLSLENPVLLQSVLANASGTASLSRTVPSGSAGLTVWIQAFETGKTTNWVKTTIN